MDPLVFILLLYFFLFVFVIYVLIFGNNYLHRNGCIGGCFRCLTIRVPNFIQELVRALLPKRMKNMEYEDCLGTQGPFRSSILLFFIMVYSYFAGTYYNYCLNDAKYIYKDQLSFHYKIIYGVLPIPWIFALILHFANPGVITADNVDGYLELYPYDNVLYKPHECPTLKIPVVPRSRFDRYTNRRIAKYDHYCPWVMAPIGERTQRFFLGFLISMTFTSAVYSYSYFRYVKYHYDELVSIKYIKLTDKFSENLSIIVRAMIMHYKMVSGTGLAMFLVFLMLLFFTIQQMYYISKNVTQIELDKYEYEDRRRRKQQVYDPVINIYDNGVFWNWMECLFPPSPHNKAD